MGKNETSIFLAQVPTFKNVDQRSISVYNIISKDLEV